MQKKKKKKKKPWSNSAQLLGKRRQGEEEGGENKPKNSIFSLQGVMRKISEPWRELDNDDDVGGSVGGRAVQLGASKVINDLIYNDN